MKRICLLFLVLISLFSCDKIRTTSYEKDVYFLNELDKDITLQIFKAGEEQSFNLQQNDSVYFTTVEFSVISGVKYVDFPGNIAYYAIISSIDSVKVIYNDVYTYYPESSSGDSYDGGIGWLLWFEMDSPNWIVRFDEFKKNYLGWE